MMMAANTTYTCRPYRSTAGRVHLEGPSPRPKTVTVDLHCHMHVVAADELADPVYDMRSEDFIRFANAETRAVNAKQHQDRFEELTGIDRRLEIMDEMLVDVQVIAPAPPQYRYGADADLTRQTSRIINDAIAEAVATHPGRFVGLCTVPLQDTGLAIAELDRAVSALGARGVEIGTSVGDEEISAPRLEPFWQRCDELGLVVVIHPMAFSQGQRLTNHYFSNIIANPLSTTVAVHHLIYDGVMERHPGLKIVLMHGGGYVSHYPARMDHAHGARPDCSTVIKEPPTTYLKRFYFDTVVFGTAQLEHLHRMWGADHLVLGTDYPYDMGEYDPVEHVYQTEGLSEAEREKICGLNAMRLLGLDPGDFAR
jgi:aminocarboxymuconate-semialdehyde decarboxylase